MTGFYPDVPSNRLAWHKDGTVFSYKGVVQNATMCAALNGELKAQDAPLGDDFRTGDVALWVFPVPVDLLGYGLFWTGDTGVIKWNLSVSSNSTTGTDGTWLEVSPSVPSLEYPMPYGSRFPTACQLAAVRMVKFRVTSTYGTDLFGFHMYGVRSAGWPADGLQICSPTVDERVSGAYFDWGDVERGSTPATKTFRVKNLSSTYTANNVRVAFEALSDASPSIVGQHTVSTDGTNFYSQRTLASIAPGALSDVLTVKQELVAGALPATSVLQLLAEAESWT